MHPYVHWYAFIYHMYQSKGELHANVKLHFFAHLCMLHGLQLMDRMCPPLEKPTNTDANIKLPFSGSPSSY